MSLPLKATRKTVVVVGGGLAGLGAASTLARDANYEVVLLEASSQLGGRVLTKELRDGTPIPLGATYFHGVEKKNSLLEFAAQNGITRRNEGKMDEEREVLHLLSDGTVLPTAAVAVYEEIVEGILEDLDKGSRNSVANNISLRDYISAEFAARTSDLKNAPPLPCSTAVLLDCFIKWEGISAGSKLLKDVDTATFGECGCLDARSTLQIPGNPFSKIVEYLAKVLPSGVVHLNSEVVSIQWDRSISSGHPVMVQCSNGVRYPADHVILTVSLGVLKEKIKTSPTQPFFSPPLPRSKQCVIERLGFGIVDKIVVEMSKPVLDQECEEIFLYWNKQDQDIPEEHHWLRDIDLLEVAAGHVAFFVADEDALIVEEQSNETVIVGVIFLLELFLSHKVVPRPTAVVRSRWGKNRLHRGSYSYPSLGSSTKDREDLSAPLSGTTPLQLMFAGEATHPTLFSTANAAYDTGIREAQRIMDLTDQHPART